MKKNGILLLIVIIVIMIFVGCTTLTDMFSGGKKTVSVTITRPAVLDVGGAKVFAVLPFVVDSKKESPSDIGVALLNMAASTALDLAASAVPGVITRKTVQTPEGIEIAKRFENVLSAKIRQSGSTLIDATSVQTALTNKQTPNVDAYISGTINQTIPNDRNDPHTFNVEFSIINAKTNKIVYTFKETLKSTELMISRPGFMYQDKRMKDGFFAMSIGISFPKESVAANGASLPAQVDVIKKQVDFIVDTLTKTYTVDKTFELLPDKTGDAKMAEANKLIKTDFGVKRENVDASKKPRSQITSLISKDAIIKAKDLFLECNYFEARYNAAMLMQVLDELYESKEIINKLVAEFPNDVRVKFAIADIDFEIEKEEQLQSQKK